MKKIIVTAAVLSLSMPLAYAAKLSKPSQKAGYAVGAEMGKQFRSQGVTIDRSSFMKGFNDGYRGRKLKMTDTQIKQALDDLRQRAIAANAKKMQQASKKNIAAQNSFLKSNAKKKGVVTLKNGMQYKILTKGTGPQPAASDTVTVNYQGKLLSGRVFDSSYARKTPATFPLNGVIKGWQQALQLMHLGAIWNLYIPADLAYGKNGMPAAGIGPNSMLIFKVQLISIKK